MGARSREGAPHVTESDGAFRHDVWLDETKLRYEKRCTDASHREVGQGAYEEWEWSGSMAELAADAEARRRIGEGLGPRAAAALIQALERAAPGVAEWSRELAPPEAAAAPAVRGSLTGRASAVVQAWRSSSSWLSVALLALVVLGIALTLGRVGLIGLERGARDLGEVWHAHVDGAFRPTPGEIVASRSLGRVERDAATAKGQRSTIVTWEGEVAFRYTLDGRTREGAQRVVVSDHVGAEAELARRLAGYREGASVVVHADAQGRAVLEPSSLPGVGAALLGLLEIVVGGVFVGLVPGLLALGVWRSRRR